MEMSPQSRVWIYQSDRRLSNDEVALLKPLVRDFVKQWAAHGKALLSFGDVLHGHFIVLMVDETHQGASGCSIDTSTRFISELQERFRVRLFDRLTIALWLNGEVALASRSELTVMLDNGEITPGTLMFDNTVLTKAQFDSSWLVPIRESWLNRSLKLQPAG